MRWQPTHDAIQLLLEGTLALSEIEAVGVRVDKTYLDWALTDTKRQIDEYRDAVKSDPIYTRWKRRYGDKTNVFSPEQLAKMVFGELGHTAKIQTSGGGRESASESALESALGGADLPFVRNCIAARHLIKARQTYLCGIQREMVQHDDGMWYIHPDYHLLARTFRSGCKNPNWQNNPRENPTMMEIVRRCFISRPEQQILEIDYAQMEVRISCAYHNDPTLINYVCDSNTDMHRDMAAQILMLDKSQISKESRSEIKADFVFACFYGSYYVQMAPAIWEQIDIQNLKLKDGSKTVRQHLTDVGITELGACDHDERPVRGTFEYHLMEIERDFWNNRFPVYRDWKRQWYDDYVRNGGCQFLTGFVMTGPHVKNDITNYPVQGSAWHCLLWSLPRINRILRKYKMRTRIIGQIHDSIQTDGPPSERDDVIDVCEKIMTRDVLVAYPWINTPIATEPEACPIGGSWFDKMGLVRGAGGSWVPSDAEKWNKKYGEWR